MMNAEFVTLYAVAAGIFTTREEAAKYGRADELVTPVRAIRHQHVAGKHTGPWEYSTILCDVKIGLPQDHYDKLRERAISKLTDEELNSLGLKIDDNGCLVDFKLP